MGNDSFVSASAPSTYYTSMVGDDVSLKDPAFITYRVDNMPKKRNIWP